MRDYCISLRSGDTFSGTMEDDQADRLKRDVLAKREEVDTYTDTEGELVLATVDIALLALNPANKKRSVGFHRKKSKEDF